jgi:hypothetical protein
LIWLRREPDLEWVDSGPPLPVESVAKKLSNILQ